ncbi:RNA-directed DNA polymerase, eukaryota [Tanacetum coccineum]
MGSYRSKEDDVSKISTSIFITNFPDSFSAKELFNSCKQYGHVVDAFIPNKRSKAGKRFGFVRFINILNEERLVNNLCTLWVGRFKFHANIAKFQRSPLKNNSNQVKNNVEANRSTSHMYKTNMGVNGAGNSYVHTVKGKPSSVNLECESSPVLMLDEECLNSIDISNSLFGRVKEFASLSNLKKVLNNEGFDNIKIQYMGELWVMSEFVSEASKKLFHANVGVGSWFSQLIQASMDFTIERRVVWVEVEGIPFKMWSGNTFKRIASKWGELLHIEDQEDKCFHSKRLCINTKVGKNIFESFKIIFRDDMGICGGASDVEEVPETVFEDRVQENNKSDELSTGQKENNSEDPFNIYSLLNKKNVIQESNKNSEHSLKFPPGFTPNVNSEVQGKNVAEDSKKESGEMFQADYEEQVNAVFKEKFSNKGSKEDVAESVCSGHFKKSVIPRTGGSILELMDELVKVGQTMGYNMDGCMNNMTAIIESQGVKEVNFLALQETKKENMELFTVKMCWGNFAFDYAHSGSVGEVVIMGDFNEVRCKSERFGSLFNVQGAKVFNSFIANAGLEEVPLGATTLAHYLSDHRPILLRESHFDYGPTPFRFFHYWFELEGFNKLVEDAWIEAPVNESNAMINMMKKLQFLKQKIRVWNRGNMKNIKNSKAILKDELEAVDAIIDKGEGNAEVVNKRMDVLKSLQDMDKFQSLEIAQKAKIKWSIEGDENSSFYHGVLNKKWSQLNIRGIMIDGIWSDSPFMVKREFLHHFRTRFDKPEVSRAALDMVYPKTLSVEQQVDLEMEVSKEEIKRTVWDCGVDKSPGPDGFTFGFYRRFWKVDFEKAYDSVRWDFLDDVLKKFGFGGKWCNWIQSCLKSSRGSIIINGSPTEEFQFYKGLKQGDPLSPFLFILIMESLHLSFQRVVDAGMFKGITLKPSLNLSHMFYADDVVFVGQWCDGSKVGGSMTRVKAWKEVVDRVNARLSKWKMKTLSIGGRVPLSMLRKLESIRNHFFNGHDTNSKKTSWVKWKNALASKEKGGLGVSSLYALNIGLMFKWVWRFFTQHKSLWVRVIKAIHGEDGKVGKQVKSKSPSYWMDIVNELTVLENKDVALKNLYPRIYALESCKYVTVGSKLAQSSLEYSFPRNPRGGIEQQQYESLLVQVHDVNLVPLSDRRIWSLESSGDFSVASVRRFARYQVASQSESDMFE